MNRWLKRVRLLGIALMIGIVPASAQSASLVLMHEGVVTWAGWSVTEQWILTTSEDGRARVWYPVNGELAETFPHSAPVRGAQWNPAHLIHFLTWDEDDTVHIWELGAEYTHIVIPHDRVGGARWSSDGTQVLTWGADGTAAIYAITVGVMETTLDANPLTISTGSPVRQAEWSVDGRHVLTFSENGAADMWDASTGERLRHYQFGGSALGADWSRDESRLLTWSTRDGVQLWEPPSNAPRVTLPHRTFVDGAKFNADETRVLSWSADDTVKVWDIDSGQPLVTLRHIDWVEGAAFNADESRILSWAYDSVFLWQEDGAKLAEFRHDLLVMGAAWNRDETQVLSWSWDDTARVWDATALTPIAEPTARPQEGQGPGDL